jgi:PTH1 family peptidyl-tRNA hydrolase
LPVEKMAAKHLRMVVGLGNPGRAYEKTRHNTGFMAADKVAQNYAIHYDQRKFKTVFGRGRIGDAEVMLAKPMDYMNRSGPPVRSLARYFGVSSKDVLVIHDDIDLAFGRLKIKEKGGHGGHNGLRSLITACGGGGFPRLRIGIGRPAGSDPVTGHVLDRYSAEELRLLDSILIRACEAVTVILTEGLSAGMNRFNDKNFLVSC